MDLVQMPDGSWVSSAEGQRAWEERNKMRERSGVPPAALTLRRRTEINLPSIIKTKDIDDAIRAAVPNGSFHPFNYLNEYPYLLSFFDNFSKSIENMLYQKKFEEIGCRPDGSAGDDGKQKSYGDCIMGSARDGLNDDELLELTKYELIKPQSQYNNSRWSTARRTNIAQKKAINEKIYRLTDSMKCDSIPGCKWRNKDITMNRLFFALSYFLLDKIPRKKRNVGAIQEENFEFTFPDGKRKTLDEKYFISLFSIWFYTWHSFFDSEMGVGEEGTLNYRIINGYLMENINPDTGEFIDKRNEGYIKKYTEAISYLKSFQEGGFYYRGSSVIYPSDLKEEGYITNYLSLSKDSDTARKFAFPEIFGGLASKPYDSEKDNFCYHITKNNGVYVIDQNLIDRIGAIPGESETISLPFEQNKIRLIARLDVGNAQERQLIREAIESINSSNISETDKPIINPFLNFINKDITKFNELKPKIISILDTCNGHEGNQLWNKKFTILFKEIYNEIATKEILEEGISSLRELYESQRSGYAGGEFHNLSDLQSKINKMEHILNIDQYKMIGGAKKKKSKKKKTKGKKTKGKKTRRNKYKRR